MRRLVIPAAAVSTGAAVIVSAIAAPTTGRAGAAFVSHGIAARAAASCQSAQRRPFDEPFTVVAADKRRNGSVTIIEGNDPSKRTTFDGGDFGLTGTGTQHFGASLTSGMFNADNYRDLAIGVPGATVTPKGGRPQRGAGAVVILYGGPTGLSASDSTVITQDAAGLSGTAHTGDAFGSALAAGRFTGGRYDDLAVGAPGEDGADHRVLTGQIDVLPGTSGGLTARGAEVVSRHSAGIPGSVRQWGSVLAAGRLTAAKRGDLIVGIPGAKVNGHPRAGRVDIVYSTATGFRHRHNQTFTENTPGVPGRVTANARFGASLATGFFTSARRDDLAIGAPDATVRSVRDAGSVDVLYSQDSGLTTRRAQLFTQTLPGVGTATGTRQSGIGAQFGSALIAAGTQRFTREGGVPCRFRRRLVVGAPDGTGRYGRGINGGAAIVVIKGSAAGLTARGSRTFEDPENPGKGGTGWGSVLGTDGWFVAIFHRERLSGDRSVDQIAFLDLGGDHATFGVRPRTGVAATALTL
ncbi:MAG TPA: integrin alpha [Mycobacteriales bacterium]|nr:integrin alpha [Mycobacteriales bacterium]